MGGFVRAQMRVFFLVIAGLSTICAHAVVAQYVAPSTQPAFTTRELPPVVIRDWKNAQRPPDVTPRAGSWTLGVGIDGFTTFGGDKNTLLLPSVTAGYFFTKSVSLNFDVGMNDLEYDFGRNGYDESSATVHDVGGLFMLRKILVHDDNTMLSADIGIGATHADGGFPTRLHQDELIRTIGLTTDIRLSSSAYLTLSARYIRAANDFFDRHPSRGFDGVSYYLGLKVLF